MTEPSESEELDFLGDGSMKDLAMRMDEIDKAIEAIHEVDKGSPQKKQEPNEGTKELPPANGSNYYETPEEASAEVEDVVLDDDDDDDDDGDAGLEDLKKEMEQFEAQQEQVPAEATGDEIITATCVKPTPTSSIGISMKTSKGITKIVAVNPNGLLAKSGLRPGLQLIRVNDVDVKNAKHAKFIIENHPGSITIMTKPLTTQ